ncbi:MAG: hypothetical protein ACRDQY_18775 [Pseudonocardiaceae bacterium]
MFPQSQPVLHPPVVEGVEVDRGLLAILQHGVPGHSQGEGLIVGGSVPGQTEPAGGEESDRGEHAGGRP